MTEQAVARRALPSPETKGSNGPAIRQVDGPAAQRVAMIGNALNTAPRVVAQRALAERLSAGSGVVQRVSIMGPIRWPAYRGGLAGEQDCNAIWTTEARTTIHNTVNAQGQITHRRITLHTYNNGAWHALGSVTMDRSQVPVAGPLMPGAAPMTTFDDSHLTLHTAAAGGAGNAGVATHLFPAVLQWINHNLRGVQQISMNPAGGAASKATIETLSARLGTAPEHAAAGVARAARKLAGGVGIGSTAPHGGALNTWDSRLNNEHLHDLHALEGAQAGLHVTADGMTIAGPGDPNELLNLQAQRNYFTGAGAPAFTHLPGHPAAAYFGAARGLTDPAIAADPKAAARILRIARLSVRSGAAGTGHALDAGYQISLTGNALAHVLPTATQP
jgi:hypothetical protein